MLTPAADRKGPIDRGVTNIRNTSLSHWLRWLKPEFRCLVLAMSFCEPTDAGEPRDRSEGLVHLDGDARQHEEPRRGVPCSFQTTASKGVVKPVHSKAILVILTRPEGCDAWPRLIRSNRLSVAAERQSPLSPSPIRKPPLVLLDSSLRRPQRLYTSPPS
jgi:putative SOS response-associated peptidase YedK